MNALEALHTRTSCSRLTQPAPTSTQLDNIYKAAMRAADHALLMPWRFLCIRGASLDKLGDLFVSAAIGADPALSEAKLASIRLKPHRAPLIIVVVAKHQDHPKVPAIEMDLSAAAAMQNMLLAAHAQDLGGMWRTGSMAYSKAVKKGLGLADNENITGFLYLGSRSIPPRKLNRPLLTDYFVDW
jgi:nitroreductase